MLRAREVTVELSRQLLPKYEEISKALTGAIAEFQKRYLNSDTVILLPVKLDRFEDVYIGRDYLIRAYSSVHGTEGECYSNDSFVKGVLGECSEKNMLSVVRNFERAVGGLERAEEHLENKTPAFSPRKLRVPESFDFYRGPFTLMEVESVENGITIEQFVKLKR